MDSRPRQALLVDTVAEVLAAAEPTPSLTERASALASTHLPEFLKEVQKQTASASRAGDASGAASAHRALPFVLAAVRARVGQPRGGGGVASSSKLAMSDSGALGPWPGEAIKRFTDACEAEALVDPDAIRNLTELRTFVRLVSGAGAASGTAGLLTATRAAIPVPTAGSRSGNAPHGGNGGAAASQRRAPLYASLSLFRPQARQRRAPLGVVRKNEAADVQMALDDAESDGDAGPGARVGPLRDRIFPTHKDYISQTPLTVTAELFDQQVRTLGGIYSSPSAEVEQATKVYVKIAMDAFALRVPLLAEYAHLREVSYGLLPSIRELLGSQYGPVRKHCFNLIATLATHAQIMDRQDAFAGAAAAVQGEVSWMLRRALEYLYLCGEGDDLLWLTALKCCLFVIPSLEDWAVIHVGALVRMGNVPTVPGAFPTAFDRITQALALHAELAVANGTSDMESSLRHLDGGGALVDLLAAAPTVESSTHLVRALSMLGRLLPAPGEAHSALERAWAALEAQRLPWCLHLLAAQPAGLIAQSIAKDLASHVLNDTDRDPDVRQELASLVVKLVGAVCAAQQVPQLVLRASLAEVIEAVPSMLTDENDAALRRCGRQLIGYALRTQSLDPRLSGGVGSAAHKTADLVSSAHPKLVMSAAAMVRTSARLLSAAYPTTGRMSLCAVATKLLDPARTSVPMGPVMALYRGVVETLAGVGPTELMATDISAMVLSGALAVCSDVFDMGLDLHFPAAPLPNVPQHLLWALYWTLRKLPSSLVAVRTARHVTLSMVCAHAPSIHWSWEGHSGIDLWHAVMEDPHAPCRVLGAERLVRFAATAKANADNAAYFYELAATAGETAPFRMATRIHRNIMSRRPMTPVPSASLVDGTMSPPPQSLAGPEGQSPAPGVALGGTSPALGRVGSAPLIPAVRGLAGVRR